MSPRPNRLHTSVLAGYSRAVLASLAQDLGHEFVAVILPLLPEAAPELLQLLAGHRGYNELWLLREHAALLWRHARAGFVERASAVLPMLSPVELFADAARAAPEEERAELRALVMAALAREEDPVRRGRALLDWAPLEPADGGAAMIAEALDVVRAAPIAVVAAIVGRFVDRFDAAQRAAVRALADRPDAGRHAAEIRMALARGALPDEAIADVRAALEQRAREDPENVQFTIYAALEVVPFEVLRPWVDSWLDRIGTRRDLCFAARRLAPHAPAGVLDRLLALADSVGVELWARAEILGDVARRHPARRDALRGELRRVLARVVGDETLGHHMSPEDVPEGARLVVLQAHAVARGSDLLAAGEARGLQRRILDRIAEMPSDFEDRYDLGHVPWGDLGEALDPGLRADAVQIALALRYRPAALKALGEMVARFPEEARHLALHGLSRLAEATPPAALQRALDGLERARSERRAPAPVRPARGAPKRRTRIDGLYLEAFEAYVTSGKYLWPDQLAELARPLARAVAARAVEIAAGVASATHRFSALFALAGAPGLAGTPEREAALAGALHAIVSDRFVPFDAREVARMLLEVSAEGDEVWIEHVAVLFEARAIEREPYLDLVEAFAPLLLRLGGEALVTELAALLRAPAPTPEFARPWTHAARVSFDA